MINAILKDAVFETTATTGVGTISLLGAQTGYSSFISRFPTGALVAYVIEQRLTDAGGNLTGIDREIGIGTLTDAAPDTLARTHVISSTNADALVNFGAGTKDVYCAPAAALFGWNLAGTQSITGNVTLNVTHWNQLLLANPTGGAFSQNLPAVASVPVGYRIGVMKTDSGANAVTIDGNGAETINGYTTFKLTAQYDLVTLVNTGTEWLIENNSASGRLGSVQTFTAGGTWNKPPGLKFAIVTVIGSGGGGAGIAAPGTGNNQAAGAGGAAGGASRKKIAASALGASETVTVGAAGTGGAAGGANNGNSGGTSSFGAHLSATGGTGGQALAAATTARFIGGGVGGVGSNGDQNWSGDDGGFGITNTTPEAIGGDGGGSIMGGRTKGTRSTSGTNNAGTNGKAYGSGGSGASASNTAGGGGAGGDGTAGIVIVEEYF